ncbi:MAG: carboxypeptidase regulatory-like domain-containing protein [Planctomycetes bacterium]|nr:carboxypeptidase regulatory-like domain-containing protein [Planctomycetota bacterium]
MMVAKLLLVVGAVAGSSNLDPGAIRGVVVNASQGNTPVGRAEVMLRVSQDGRLVPLATTTTDAEGRFAFVYLPVDPRHEYLPGANRDGVHYPGQRVQLVSQRPQAAVTLAVHDSIAHPSPLVVRRHEIVICPQPGVLRVTETLLVANPSLRSYVGRAGEDEAGPVTLRLSIPSDFERTTFQKEFFGRRFSLADGQLVTTIPWTPGERELKFTYVLRNTERRRVWLRPLDLPCSDVCVRVRTTKPEEITCNLPTTDIHHDGDLTELVFQSSGQDLPAGHVLQVELGQLPVAWMVYGRWLALAILLLLIAAASVVRIRRRSQRSGQSDPDCPGTKQRSAHGAAGRRAGAAVGKPVR